MQKKIISLVLLMPLMLQLMATNPVPCKCFHYSADGSTQYTYDYLVGANQGCCSGTVSGNFGSMMTSILNQGQWQFVSDTVMTSSEAQDACCPNT